MLSALLVFAGTSVLAPARGFAAITALLVVVWLTLAWRVGHTYASITQPTGPRAAV